MVDFIAIKKSDLSTETSTPEARLFILSSIERVSTSGNVSPCTTRKKTKTHSHTQPYKCTQSHSQTQRLPKLMIEQNEEVHVRRVHSQKSS